MEPDIRQTLSNLAIRDMHAEMDFDCMRRHARGQRLFPDGRGGYEWAYVVDDHGNTVHLRPGEHGSL